MFGKGNKSKKRGIWIFGGIMRNNGNKEGFDFSKICQNKKNQKSVLENYPEKKLISGTTIYSDNCKTYRKLPTCKNTSRNKTFDPQNQGFLWLH